MGILTFYLMWRHVCTVPTAIIPTGIIPTHTRAAARPCTVERLARFGTSPYSSVSGELTSLARPCRPFPRSLVLVLVTALVVGKMVMEGGIKNSSA